MEFESAAALNDPKKMHNKIPVASWRRWCTALTWKFSRRQPVVPPLAAAFFAANQTTHFAFGTGTMLVVIGRICMD